MMLLGGFLFLVGLGILVVSTLAPLRTTSPAVADPVVINPAPAGATNASAPRVSCVDGDPHHRTSSPDPSRLHSGLLSMPLPAGWEYANPGRMPFATDVALAQFADPERDDLQSWAAVGSVAKAEPFNTPEQAAASIVSCLRQGEAGAELQITHAGPSTLAGAGTTAEQVGTLTQEEVVRDLRVVVADVGDPTALTVYVRIAEPGTNARAALDASERQLGVR